MMRVFIIILLLCLLICCLVIRPLLGKPLMKISAVLLLLILVPTGVFEILWQRTEAVGTEMVRYASNNPAGHLSCQRFTEALLDISNRAGEVDSREPNTAVVHWQTCRDFQSWLASDKTKPSLEQIIAVHVVVHEAIHVSGDYNEASTECKAITLDPTVAQRFGATPTIAAQMQQTYIRDVYPRLSSAYRGPCPVVG